MHDIIATWKGDDSSLLAELNKPKHKRIVNGGLVALAMIAAVDQNLAGNLVLTLKRSLAHLKSTFEGLPDGKQKDAVEAQFELFDSFRKRLTESSYGAPIDSDNFRATVTGLLTSGLEAPGN